jgi:hypothetical protein
MTITETLVPATRRRRLAEASKFKERQDVTEAAGEYQDNPMGRCGLRIRDETEQSLAAGKCQLFGAHSIVLTEQK